jgi:hypothetical protein
MSERRWIRREMKLRCGLACRFGQGSPAVARRVFTAACTSTSTKNRLIMFHETSKVVISAVFPASERTITSSTWRRIRTGTAGSGAAEFRSNSRSYRWGRRRRGWSDLVSNRKPRGYQIDMRSSAGKRQLISASTSTGTLPVVTGPFLLVQV